MADEIEDRGDAVELLGDEAGDTASEKTEDGKEPETKEPESKEPEGEKPEGKESDEEPRIPKSRFDQAVKKARDAEKAALEKAEKLQAELSARQGTVDFDKIEGEIDALEDKLEDAIKDGNVEAKQRIRREIRAKTGQIAEAKSAAYSQYATAVAIEQIRYDAAVERMEIEHPELNPDNEDTFDEEKVKEVGELKADFEAAGQSSTVALKKAIKYVYGNAAAAPKKEEPKTEEPDLKKKAEEAGAKRTADAVKKGLEVKGKQPSNEKAGVDSDKAGKSGKSADINLMSDKDFDKLDEAEKKRMRGDDV